MSWDGRRLTKAWPITRSYGRRPRAWLDLGTLGGTSSYAYDVNEAGAVVGYSYTTGDTEIHAFVWTRTNGMVDLGTLGGANSFAYAVNDQGQVVGNSQTAEALAGHAFVWTASEGMVDLAPLAGHAYSDAFLVNSGGQVVGISYSENRNTDARATMWLARGASR
jgi:probable HAF family extracellular repeat protein